uniref:Ion_trans domain-containing protein n=1 Tax=Heterorhabditis bacteriophora TaxID=37862 RepID=A0A1I7X0I9_HETBA
MSASSRFDLDSLSGLSPLSSLCDVTDSAPLQPVRAEESDQLFLSLSNHHYSEMKTYVRVYIADNLLIFFAMLLNLLLYSLVAVKIIDKTNLDPESTAHIMQEVVFIYLLYGNLLHESTIFITAFCISMQILFDCMR